MGCLLRLARRSKVFRDTSAALDAICCCAFYPGNGARCGNVLAELSAVVFDRSVAFRYFVPFMGDAVRDDATDKLCGRIRRD